MSELRQIATPLYLAKGWMKFLAVMMIIMGVVTALSIVGLLIAWLPLWLGVLLFQAANRADDAYTGEDEASLIAALGKIRTFFVINGVLMLIYLVLMLFGMMSFGMIAALAM